MTIIYNIEPYKATLVFKVGDTVNMTFDVYRNDVLYDISGMQLDIQFRRKDGILVKELSSAGVSPKITIVTSSFTMYDTGFVDINVLDYDIQLTNGTDIETIMEGEALIKKQITA